MSDLNTFLTEVADAIRNKKGTTEKINAQNFASEIEGIVTGQYNIEVVEKTDENGNKTQALNIFDWNYEPPKFDRVFANNTPAQISMVSAEIEKNGYTSAQVAEIYGWNLGDKIPITLTNGEIIEVRIIGFNHDTLSSDHTSKAGITLDMVNCLATKYPINSSNTNAGGYFGSNFVTQNLPTIYNLLPDEWKAIIKPVDKKTANGGGTNYTETITQSCNIFLQAEIEIIGAVTYAQDGANEGTQYEYWANKAVTDRIKKYDKNANGVADTATEWWLRSCTSDYSAYICNVEKDGTPAYVTPIISYGISFALCV